MERALIVPFKDLKKFTVADPGFPVVGDSSIRCVLVKYMSKLIPRSDNDISYGTTQPFVLHSPITEFEQRSCTGLGAMPQNEESFYSLWFESRFEHSWVKPATRAGEMSVQQT